MSCNIIAHAMRTETYDIKSVLTYVGLRLAVLPRNLLLNNVQDDSCMGAGSDLVAYIG